MSRRQSWRDSQQDCAKIFATVNLLLGENLGEICSRILGRFWPLGLLLPGENLGELRGRIAPRFWPPGFLLLCKNLGEIHCTILVRFWPPGFLLPSENLGEICGTIQRDFGHRDFCFPARILPGSRQDTHWKEKSWRPKSRQDHCGRILPRSRSLFHKGGDEWLIYFTAGCFCCFDVIL